MSLLRIAVTLAALAVCGSAAAQSKTWNFGDVTAPGSCSGPSGTIGNTAACTDQAAAGGAPASLSVNAFSVSNSAGAAFAKAAITFQGEGSGFGVSHAGEPTGSPQHAVDNEASTDTLLLSFTGKQVLQNVTIGWRNTDSDFQVLRWTGANAAVVEGKTTAGLLSSGWALVSTVDGQGGSGASSADVTYGVNGGNLSSSYWLISAFNSAFGNGGTSGFDAVKVLAVTATAGVTANNTVAEPGSLALAGLALAGVLGGGMRRRSPNRAV